MRDHRDRNHARQHETDREQQDRTCILAELGPRRVLRGREDERREEHDEHERRWECDLRDARHERERESAKREDDRVRQSRAPADGSDDRDRGKEPES